MIEIEKAIELSKSMMNISDGGSKCYDFGDVVLVKYTCPTRYLKNGNRSRGKSEKIMEAVNRKNEKGVNTPKHLAVRRVIEGEDDVCYVLQEKCKGFNCASRYKYGVSFERACSDLEFVLNIPYEHYQKLIFDGCRLFEMGYEAKNKNLFYDSETGFWYIDFLDNEEEYTFDPNDIKKIFEAVRYRVPKPLQMASSLRYDEKLSPEQTERINELEFFIKAKTLLAIKSVLPLFTKFEKFFLLNESSEYKKYLMENGIVQKNLFEIEDVDYDLFNELYEIIMKGLIDKIVNKGKEYWDIEVNEIRCDSELFSLQLFFEQSKLNILERDSYEDEFDYSNALSNLYQNMFIDDLVERLKQLEPNDNITKFLSEVNERMNRNSRRI